MTKRKKIIVEKSVTEPEKPKTPVRCIDCRWIELGTWRGPTCLNPASPFYERHRADTGTCEVGEERIATSTPPTVIPPEAITAISEEEGLYNPGPVHPSGVFDDEP